MVSGSINIRYPKKSVTSRFGLSIQEMVYSVPLMSVTMYENSALCLCLLVDTGLSPPTEAHDYYPQYCRKQNKCRGL